MKKILLCLTVLCSALLITGCGSEKVELNLKELPTKIEELESERFDRFSASLKLNESIENLEDIYDFDFEEKFGLTAENIENYSIGLNDDTMDLYFLVMPKDGKMEEVKEEIDKYFETLEKSNDEAVASKAKNRSFDTAYGYLMYIMADNSGNLLQDVKSCKEKVFGALMEVNDEMLSNTFNINKNDVDEYLIRIPMMITSSNSYIIIKPKDGKTDEIKKSMDEYMTKLEDQWKTYLASQYELVSNRLEEEYGDYLIYVISNDNQLVFDTIKANKLN